MTLSQLTELFVRVGARKLYAKPLAENDNSKNQVYLGSSFQALNLLPNEGVSAVSTLKNPIFKAKLRFCWLGISGSVADAPGAQLILYPQYPEVRFSGFLKGCIDAPSLLMGGRLLGRVLFLGVTSDRRVVGFVAGASTEIAAEFRSLSLPTAGVFAELALPSVPDTSESRSRLLAELRRIHALGWIDSKQLDSHGMLTPCLARNCGGLTLEAELNISKNSTAQPDFLGWEVKQHAVRGFGRPVASSLITLMTPEPTGGFYREHGVEAFTRRFGYSDKRGRPDRLNFGGTHRCGMREKSTGLTLQLRGFDPISSKITDVSGAIELVNDAAEVAAAWAFTGLLEHWARKHAQAAYVPSMRRKEPAWQYSFGHTVRLMQETDGLRFLVAVAAGRICYDPGIKLENASSARPRHKSRSQFRVASKDLSELYERADTVSVRAEA